ncbi:FMN adenylyltransferase NDAI_0A06720 [Naumovozyma dairenensis CBS 421]|uniref:FAD synthase n=1 Tax=Naumovozyma dairenensis (strain ATCC 10597 / BCRC 20456 / CBS 421 / NBRC 0211 / NRRL Y-12639) TaxID=1071378 RepID=G0W4T8_NAUDC|nr:hypothetical protein NDAI_0A06720 [Naumovozyma dairenensis CBS 421]CCD22826.1 hypothetical protein NDAI_0A06720 [Naumovozyma dairenensis CBS 421]
MGLSEVSELCYKITESYLKLNHETSIIIETQNAIRLTRHYLLDDIFTRWSPINGEISFSYNGGKDCQVLLLLYLSCLWEFFIVNAKRSQFEAKYQKFPMEQLPTVFIDQDETFTTLENFILETSKRYNLSLYESKKEVGRNQSMADAFRDFLKIYPETKAIAIGVRSTDPYGELLKPIQKTDSNWPNFTRLQPLLHWKLANIWSFLLFSNEPICALYVHGFTSIGGIKNTIPNPYLAVQNKENKENKAPKLYFEWEIKNSFNNGESPTNKRIGTSVSYLDKADEKISIGLGQTKFFPGWYLIDDALERAGRLKK